MGFRYTGAGGPNFHFPVDFTDHPYNSVAATAQPVKKFTWLDFDMVYTDIPPSLRPGHRAYTCCSVATRRKISTSVS